MGPEIALASTIIGAGKAAGSTATVAGLTASQIGAGISAASGLVSGFMSFSQQRAAGKAAQIASQEQAAEIRLKAQAEQVQGAKERAEMERRLRRSLAQQRANFAAGGIETTSGTPMTIADETTSEFQRNIESSRLRQGLAVSSINQQAMSTLRAGYNRRLALNNNAMTSLIGSVKTFGNQMSDLSDTFKGPTIDGSSGGSGSSQRQWMV